MHVLSRSALVFLLALELCLSLGCSDDSTEPEDSNPPPSTAMKHIWSKNFGDGANQHTTSIAADAAGNVIATGHFEGTVHFGVGALTSAGSWDIFLAKFQSDGTHLWSMRFGDAAYQYGMAVATDASGNVIVAGYFTGTVDFGGGAFTSSGYDDIYIAKFGPDGSYLWSKHIGGIWGDVLQAAGVDGSGNIIVTGYFSGDVDFGGGVLTASPGSGDIFVAKYGPDGTHIWSKRFGEVEPQSGNALAVDASGNVIVAGSLWGQVSFGGGMLTSAGSRDIFLVKFDPDGTHLWSKRFGDSDDQAPLSVAVAASGDVHMTGWFAGTVYFGGGGLTSAGSSDVFVAKFGSDGGHLWSKRFGDTDGQRGVDVAVDASGNSIIIGDFNSIVDFGGGALASAGGSDVFVAKFGSDGGHLWSKRFGDADAQHAYTIAVDASKSAIIGGYFAGAVDFGGGVLTSVGGEDIYFAKFGPSSPL